ncbi:hypothetical protein Dda_8397 [Drechslerella dactyloides]|uniref:Uncharacterized protein n=1 Tax=Drechslerella dactyloides TaxID=74499 RepID=A0AAD6IQB7_DREDA|nr:hypothetical protein Dda_8397 [Drechslerella dactyloides]
MRASTATEKRRPSAFCQFKSSSDPSTLEVDSRDRVRPTSTIAVLPTHGEKTTKDENTRCAQAMTARERTFFLAPESHWELGKIKLGSILRDPKDPGEAIEDYIHIPAASTHETTKQSFLEVITDFKRHKFSILAQFLQLFLGAGADVAVSRGQAEYFRVEAERVTTTYFEPPLDYLQQSLHIPTVQILCRRNIRKPLNLFMVTAIMVVEGLNVTTVSGKVSSIEGSIGVDGTMTGLPVGGSSGIGIERGAVLGVTAVAPGPLVFAYQVRELRRKNWRNASAIKAARYTKGAQLDSGAEPGAGPRLLNLTDNYELAEDPVTDGCEAENSS